MSMRLQFDQAGAVNDHLCRITELVEEMGHIPIAMEFLTCIVYWCLTMLYASTVMNVKLE